MPPRQREPDDQPAGNAVDNPAGNSASVRTRRIREIARDVLDFEEFRPGQEAAMQAVVSGRDTLAVLPSGAGKTAVYQVAGQLMDGPVVVVSPLIALQRDQLERIEELGDRMGE
ncbi:MAG: ATP-dependent helicase, RecQ family, partial [Frankiales bacterium]|nr:ATP-dependent helicase, RecQ family [Frankiales bacterium]